MLVNPKDEIRAQVSARLLEIAPDGSRIAFPDVVFDLALDHYIADFTDSPKATERLTYLVEWQQARKVFITPDNSTRLLRELAIKEGKEMVMTTYGIRRGSVLMRPAMVEPGHEEYASTLAGMERLGLLLPTIEHLQDVGEIDLMVTGALAISRAHGGRAGKGAGWFDAEWGIWRALGLIKEETPVIGIVHDVQVVPQRFPLAPWDSHATVVVTPTETIRPPALAQPNGILWGELRTESQWRWAGAIPYLRQLYMREFRRPFPALVQ